MIKEQQHVKAVRYACAFGLRERFQPASLLKDFLKNAAEVSKTLGDNINGPVKNKVNSLSRYISLNLCIFISLYCS